MKKNTHLITLIFFISFFSQLSFAIERTLLDLVGELSASTTQKSIPIFSSTLKEPNSACTLNYKKVGGDFNANLTFLKKTDIIKNLISSSVYSIGTWTPHFRVFPQGCSFLNSFKPDKAIYKSVVSTAPNFLNLDVQDTHTSEHPLSLKIASDVIQIGAFTNSYWKAAFGYPLFRKTTTGPNTWAHLLVGKSILQDSRLPNSPLKDYIHFDSNLTGLNFIFDGELKYINVRTGTITVPSGTKIPDGAQVTYDRNKHATQLRISMILQYIQTPAERAEFLCNSETEKKPECAYHGRYIPYMLSIYDYRFEYISRTGMNTMAFDIGTGTIMYRDSLENLMSASQKANYPNTNPFKIVHNRFKIDTNILPKFKEAIINTVNTSSASLPPRLMIGTTPETDAQYLSHFVISSANVGYEISGISGIVFNIYNFKLIGNYAN